MLVCNMKFSHCGSPYEFTQHISYINKIFFNCLTTSLKTRKPYYLKRLHIITYAGSDLELVMELVNVPIKEFVEGKWREKALTFSNLGIHGNEQANLFQRTF